jgi:ADP-ribosylglycohydrolase
MSVRSESPPTLRDRMSGVLLGTMVGDALGLPAEGLPRRRIARRWRGVWKHRFILGRGMISDDTEHALFVAQALLDHPCDVEGFRRCLAWKLRWWLSSIPAGIGLATLRATLKLWMGWPAHRSGVFSAGNGPAMRVAILGAFFHEDTERREQYVRASTRLTHTDPRALTGSLAVAEVVASHMRTAQGQDPRPSEVLRTLRTLAARGDGEWPKLVDHIDASLARGDSVERFADRSGLENGVTGYVYHTVPVAIYAVLRHRGEFDEALRVVLALGGDTDTVGAIVGAMAGAAVGAEGIPERWIAGVADWPRTPVLLRSVAERLVRQQDSAVPLGRVRYCWPGVVPRNLLFTVTVLLHGLRRLVPA